MRLIMPRSRAEITRNPGHSTQLAAGMIRSSVLRPRNAIPTADLAPGYYDIRLGAPFVDYQWVRVEVVAPAE